MKSASTIAQFDYTLNAVGNRTAKNASGAIPNVNESYTYDAIDQVTAVSKPGDAQTFAYDPTGNRTAVTSTGSSPGVGSYTTNALNQYSAAAGDVLPYDTKGNLTTQGLSASYNYDSKNRLLGATKGSNLYAYVANNPVNIVDPMGLEAWFKSERGLHTTVTVSNPASPTGYSAYDYEPNKGGLKDPANTWDVEGTMNKRPVERPTNEIDSNTTPEQDAKLREAGDKVVENPGMYNPIFNNCATVSRQQMVDAGILPPTIPNDILFPGLVEFEVRVTIAIRSLLK